MSSTDTQAILEPDFDCSDTDQPSTMYGYTIQDRLRANSVKRWHIVQMSREQSLAEHSYNVAMIAMEISKRKCNPYIVTMEIGSCALFHDIDEVVKGDAPTPSKNKQQWVPSTEFKHWEIIKMADLIDAYWYVSEYGLGRHAKEVAHYCYMNIRQALNGLDANDASVVQGVLNEIMCGEFKI